MQDQDGTWKAFTLFLMLNDIKGHEEKGARSGYYDGHTTTWNEVYEKARIEKDPDLIIGEHLFYTCKSYTVVFSRCRSEWIKFRCAVSSNEHSCSID